MYHFNFFNIEYVAVPFKYFCTVVIKIHNVYLTCEIIQYNTHNIINYIVLTDWLVS